jgi:hypothetical protein
MSAAQITAAAMQNNVAVLGRDGRLRQHLQDVELSFPCAGCGSPLLLALSFAFGLPPCAFVLSLALAFGLPP